MMSGHAAQESQAQSISKIVAGLLSCIRQETEALRANERYDMAGSNARKSRLLYELNRAAGGLDTPNQSPELRLQLKTLRVELATNALLVRGHVTALREISEMMINLVRRDEADGTYVKQRRGYAAW
jgi:hypothetical protein